MKYLTVKDYAKKIGKTKKTVYNMIKDGRIEKERVKTFLNTFLIKD
ncbi:unnamed protein product [marine sediment metagenome]|uniref:Helix-turn-helix domain-containing protein n=1 Tax=marine sediment metagenome TaxID=412755 RepID=X0SY53_9ZZZZ